MKMLICPSDSPDSTSDAGRLYVCKGRKGFNQPCLGVCLGPGLSPPGLSRASGIDAVLTVSRWIYINSHHGSSTTLLAGGIVARYPGGPPQLFVLRTAKGDISHTSLAKWSTPPSIQVAPTWTKVLTHAVPVSKRATYPGQRHERPLRRPRASSGSQWSVDPEARRQGVVAASGPAWSNRTATATRNSFTDNIDLCTFMMLMTPYDAGIPGRPNSPSTTIPNTAAMTKPFAAWNNSGNQVTLPYVPVATAVLDESKFQ